MKFLNNLVVQVSHSAGLFIFSAVLAFGSLFIVFFNINAVFEPMVGAQLFDFQNELTVEQVFQQLPNYNDAALALYSAFVFIDFLFPVFASLTLGAASAFAVRYLSSNWYATANRLNLFTIYFVPATFDWIENISAITVINAYPNELMAAAGLLVLAKKGKLASVMALQPVSWVLLLVALLKWIGAKVGLIK
jgi:hypothetical protein